MSFYEKILRLIYICRILLIFSNAVSELNSELGASNLFESKAILAKKMFVGQYYYVGIQVKTEKELSSFFIQEDFPFERL